MRWRGRLEGREGSRRFEPAAFACPDPADRAGEEIHMSQKHDYSKMLAEVFLVPDTHRLRVLAIIGDSPSR